MVYVAIILILLISFIQIKGLLKEGLIKESVVYFTIVSIAIFYIFNNTFELNFPKPFQLISALLEPLGKLVFGDS